MTHSKIFPPLGLAAVLVAFAAVVYWPSIDGGFTFDDYPNIVLYEGVQPDSWTELSEALSHPFIQDRPVARLTFALNYLAAGLDPSAYHATNVAIHAATAAVLFALLLALARAPRGPPPLRGNALAFAFIGALLWALHPVNTQAVSYIVQRMASLGALFYLVTLLVFAVWRLGQLRARIAVPLLALFWALGLGTKLNVASAPAAWWLLEVAFFTGLTRRNGWIGATIAVVGLGGAALVTESPLRHLVHTPPERDYSGLQRLLTQPRVLWHYLSLVVWPDADRLQVDYDFAHSRSLIEPVSTLVALLALAALTALAVLAVHKQRLLWPACGWLFFLVASSVESSWLLLELAFEHRVYLPLALLLPGLIAPLFLLPEQRRSALAARLGLLVLGGAIALQTVERNRLWGQPGKLWAQALEGQAKEARARINAAGYALRQGRTDDLRRLMPDDSDAASTSSASLRWDWRAAQAIIDGRPDEAVRVTRQRLQRAPRDKSAAYLYGLSNLRQGNLEVARSMARQMQQRIPDSHYNHLLQALVQAEGGAYDAAITRLRTWLAGNPDAHIKRRQTFRLRLGNILQRAGETSAAVEQYRAILAKDPHNWTAWLNLAQIYRGGGDADRAQRIEEYLRSRNVDVERLRTYGQPRPDRASSTAH